MAWHNKFSLSFLALTTSALIAGCNVGKSDTVAIVGAGDSPTTSTTSSTSNTGTYSGGFTSPVKLLCIDAPGLDPTGHGTCGQRYTLEGSVSFTVQGDTITGGNVSVYGYDRPLTAPAKIDASGNVTFSFEHINGSAKVVNGVMSGIVWEGPFEWKYGEFKFTKK